ncbi:MAG: tRNA threonylcarbamoyladenosine dehydratase [Clostridia bacterium]|nr:tRNA threonylcarbamoyladenosine dehydratase [Clostridia bacterium]
MSLERTELLFGAEAMERLKAALVVVVGIGGVGGHAAESLARSGVGRLILIDGDEVESSNLNRQIFASKDFIGMAKTEAAKQRLNQVSDAEITGLKAVLTAKNVSNLIPKNANFVIDAIDDLNGKVSIIEYCKRNDIPFISCLGAGNRTDPTAFTVTDIEKTEYCPLARKLRKELRRLDIRGVSVVFSKEKPSLNEARRVGSFAPVTGTCGLVAAAWACKKIINSEVRT